MFPTHAEDVPRVVKLLSQIVEKVKPDEEKNVDAHPNNLYPNKKKKSGLNSTQHALLDN